MLLRLSPLILAVVYALIWWQFSAWATKRRLQTQSKPLMDPTLREDCARLAQMLEVEALPVFILEDRAINALAGPDGRVYLNRGLYQLYVDGKLTQAEIMSVICHELGHLALKHTQKRMLDFGAQNALRTGLAMLLSRFIPFGGYIAAGLIRLIAARISRADEFEADSFGTALMVKLGHGPGPVTTMLEKIAQFGAGARPPAWLASHPDTKTRIAAIEKTYGAW